MNWLLTLAPVSQRIGKLSIELTLPWSW